MDPVRFSLLSHHCLTTVTGQPSEAICQLAEVHENVKCPMLTFNGVRWNEVNTFNTASIVVVAMTNWESDFGPKSSLCFFLNKTISYQCEGTVHRVQPLMIYWPCPWVCTWIWAQLLTWVIVCWNCRSFKSFNPPPSNIINTDRSRKLSQFAHQDLPCNPVYLFHLYACQPPLFENLNSHFY